MANFDDLQGAVAQFGAGNVVKFDNIGMPSIMVELATPKYSDVITGGTDEVLPFWIVDGEQKIIFVSKFANIVENGRAYSLAMKLPRNYITWDEANAACLKKGAGWHLNQTGVFTYLNLLSQRMGTVPHGNTNYGRDYYHAYERGIQPKGETQRTLTGSGQPTWFHNHSTSGIADLNGNVWEWTSGLRLKGGEIQIIPYGNSMKIDCDMSEGSTLWKAIKTDGTLVAPGTAGTLKISGSTISTTVGGNMDCIFKNITAASGVTIPKLLVALGLFPDSGVSYENAHIWCNVEGERLPLCGSAFDYTSHSGGSARDLRNSRSNSYGDVGFRSALYE